MVRAEVAVHALVDEKEPPILTVEVEVAEVPALRHAVHRKLRIAAKNVLKLIRFRRV